MIKKFSALFFLFSAVQLLSQNDSIFNYLDSKGKITTDMFTAKYFETVVKQSDSIWMTKRYKKNGKFFSYLYSTTSDNTKKIGQHIELYDNDSISFVRFYNKNGLLHGKITTYFDNGNLSLDGRFIEGKKDGLWHFYHYDGLLASKTFYKNDSLLKTYYFDNLGNEIDEPKIVKRKSFFDNGKRTFKEELQLIFEHAGYIINGKIEISFVIHIDGKLKNIAFSVEIPSDLERNLIKAIENLKGWNPEIINGRPIPTKLSIPINFK